MIGINMTDKAPRITNKALKITDKVQNKDPRS